MLVAAMAVLLSGLLGACGKHVDAPEARLAEGGKFPPLTLGSTSGDVLSTTSYEGKLLVLNVWATWCPPCRREMPSLERLSHALDPKRFAVIGLSTDEDEILATEFLLQNHITFANFFDKSGKLAKQLGMKVYPETFLVAPDGTLLQRLPGLHEWDGQAMIAHLEDAYRRHRLEEMNDMKGHRQDK
ncbi:TlpA disulfide reductase family protein [Noviherbaspirillum sp.]|uniref:TlpA disulfide reductase family protein n=1 Tax=Noviherbaspirillum sp. TaxID=1926288 RepID=UPI0025DB4255|nr:TlpA disulfide reductase family protein [Noviherbaspirillum sp.]